MTIDEFDIKVGHGTGQIMSIIGMVAGYGVTLSSAIMTMAAVLPKTGVTVAIVGFGTILGTASNWLLVHARNKTIEAKVDAYGHAVYAAGLNVEKLTGVDVPVVEPDAVPPTLPRI